MSDATSKYSHLLLLPTEKETRERLRAHKDDGRCCGNCTHFRWEDSEGYGWCDTLRNRGQHCSQKCVKWEKSSAAL